MSERASAVEIVRVGKHWRLSCFQHVPHPTQEVFSFFWGCAKFGAVNSGLSSVKVSKVAY